MHQLMFIRQLWTRCAAALLRSPTTADSVERERRRQVFESDDVRNAGWYVEVEGRRVAQLTDPRYEEMFWDSYRIEPLTENPRERRLLLASPEYWLTNDLVYRSRRCNDVARWAFVADPPFAEPGRLKVRGLYLLMKQPTFLE